MTNAYITGAGGFVGRALLAHWLGDGRRATCLCRKILTDLPEHPACRVVHGSLSDSAANLARAMAGCDIVFHLAAKVSFHPADRADLIRDNADGTERIIEAARIARVPRLVIVSSACTIGLSDSPDRILDEATPFDEKLARRNPYLHSKHLTEMHALSAAESGANVVIVNPTTIFGAGDRTLNSGTLIKQVAQSKVMPVPPGGSNVVSISDVVRGIIAAGERGRPGRRYILGGHNLRFSEIIGTISRVVGRRPWCVPVHSIAQIPMMGAAWTLGALTRSRLITPQIIADTFAFKYYSSGRAEAELGWRAEQGFEDAVAEAWEFYLANGLITPPSEAAA